jgi:hypothetical protein
MWKRQRARSDIDVVLDEVDLPELALGEEDLVRIGDVDLLSPDLQLHVASIEKSPFGGMPRIDGSRDNEIAGSPSQTPANHAAPAQRTAAHLLVRGGLRT